MKIKIYAFRINLNMKLIIKIFNPKYKFNLTCDHNHIHTTKSEKPLERKTN
jgi:hypothetical protein